MAAGTVRTLADRLVERSAVDIEKADMVVTCSVDLKGCTRMAQRLPTLVLQQDFGNSVQFHMEYLKYSVWEELKKSSLLRRLFTIAFPNDRI